MGTTSTEAKASSLIAAAWELKASRIAYCFESRASLIAECRRLRDAQARLMSAQALRSAKAAAFAERLLRALSASGEDTRAEFSAHGISPDEIDRFLASMRAEGGSRPEANSAKPAEGQGPRKPEAREAPADFKRGATPAQRKRIDGLVEAGTIREGESSSSDTRPRKPSRRPRPCWTPTSARGPAAPGSPDRSRRRAAGEIRRPFSFSGDALSRASRIPR